IRRNDRRRLARLAMPLVWAERHAVERRVELRRWVEIFSLIGALLAIEDVDPESTCLMDRLHEAEAELAAIPDTPALRRADEEYLARADTRWVDEEWERGRRYRPPPPTSPRVRRSSCSRGACRDTARRSRKQRSPSQKQRRIRCSFSTSCRKT